MCTFGSVLSIELGGALGKGLFTYVSPTTGVWLRYVTAASILILFRAITLGIQAARGTKPRLTRPPRAAWRWTIAYCACLFGMNWTFYLALDHMPVGVAVTIEYLGPLSVAILGSRRLLDFAWAGLAALGVALLGLGPGTIEPIGIVFICGAAAGWATYILIGSRAMRYWNGTDLVILALTCGTMVLAGPAIAVDGPALTHPVVLQTALLVGFFSSVLSGRLDIASWGRISPALFGIVQSLAAAVAALAGFLVLGERLDITD